MKNNLLHIKRNSLILLIGCLLVVPLLSSNLTLASVSESTDIPDFTLTALTPHTAISILNDTAFTLYGFPGDGSSDNPYRIENLNITTSYIHGILVTGTTANFTIQDCYIDALAFGINIESIAVNTAEIKRNYCVNNTENGITLYNALAVNITDNFCVNNGQGIYTDYADFSIFANNSLYKNDVGMYLYDTYDSIILNNTCIENLTGIIFESCQTNILEGNKCKDGIDGIILDPTWDLIVTENICENLTGFGMWISTSDGAHFTNNTIIDCNTGINIESTYDSLFTFNRIQGSVEYGVNVTTSDSYDNIFHHNAFVDNALGFGTSQANDLGDNSTWYDVFTNEGNFWNDHSGTGNYSIDGDLFFDLYPLAESPVPIVPELNGNHFSAFFLLLIFVIPSVLVIKRRNRN